MNEISPPKVLGGSSALLLEGSARMRPLSRAISLGPVIDLTSEAFHLNDISGLEESGNPLGITLRKHAILHSVGQHD